VEGATIWSVFQVVAVLLLMVWLIPSCARRLARRGSMPAGHRLRILESVSCGGSRALCLVRAGTQELLLGVTDGGITLLQVLENPGPDVTTETEGEGFRELLARVWSRGGRGRA